MRGTIHLGRIAGVAIDLHATWFIIFAIVVVMVGMAMPASPDLPREARWLLVVITALAFFFSVLLHELAHSITALRLGIGISGITLFVFGGVSRMTSEPKSAGAEFKMAIVGPLTSAVLGAILYGLSALIRPGGEGPLWFSLYYLGIINVILAGFNLLPGFPLDGGRVLRAIVWGATADLRHATHVASIAGQWLAYLMIIAGVLWIPLNWLNRLYLILLGWFLLDAARSSYQQQLLQTALSGIHVRDIMTPNVVVVPPQATLQQAVDAYFLRLNYAAFPVAEGDELRGILTLPHVRQVPREQWSRARVAEVVEPLAQERLVAPAADAWDALAAMASGDHGRLLVVEGGHLVGIISRTDIMRFLRTKLELGV